MPSFYRGVIAGSAIVIALAFAYVIGFGNGRAGIVNDCVEHRAFTYGDGAWGCVRLRKDKREVEKDEILPQGEKTNV